MTFCGQLFSHCPQTCPGCCMCHFSFSWPNNIPGVALPKLVQPSSHGRTYDFQYFTIMNKAVMNTCVHVFCRNICFHVSGMNAQECTGWVVGQLHVSFLRAVERLCHFTFPLAVYETAGFPKSSVVFVWSRLFVFAVLTGVERCLTVGSVCVSRWQRMVNIFQCASLVADHSL